MLLKLTLIAWCATAMQPGIFTNDEVDVILSSLKLLKIGNCILMSDSGKTAESEIKKFNKNLVLTSFMGQKGLEMYLRESRPPDAGTAIVMKVKSTSVVKGLLTENSKRLFWFVWFLISSENNLDDEIRIPFNCQFFQIRKGPDGTHWLIENYHIKNSSTYKNEFGFWSPKEGLHVYSLNMHNRRTDFKGIELEITLCHRFKAENMIKIFWMDSARILNFSLKMELQRLNKTSEGYVLLQDPDGSNCIWGITGLDFDRDWIFLDIGIIVRLAMKYRGSNDIGWRAYVKPFKNEMWVAIGVWLFLLTLAIVLVNGCTKKTLYLNVFTAFFCLCNSDPMAVHPPSEPIPPPTKLVYLMALVIPAVLVPAYSAYILSTLSIILPLEPFNDLKGLLADGTYKITAVDNTFALRYLSKGTDPDIKYVYDHLFVGANNVPPDYLSLFKQLCKDNKLAGFIPYTRDLHNYFQCRMFVIPQNVITISSGVLLPKGSPLRKLFNERFSQYHEKGIYRLEENISFQFHKVLEEETDKLRSLNMSEMQAIFLLIPVGIILSFIVLAVEFIVKKYQD